jgi:DNA-binding NarL/FixJ family response regulator
VQRLRGGRSKSPIERLSSREFEIFCLLAEGRSAAEIGERLSLSSKTVANYATQIKSRLGVNSAAELTRLAIRYGVLEP